MWRELEQICQERASWHLSCNSLFQRGRASQTEKQVMTSNRGVVYLEPKKALFWLLLLAATLGGGCKTYVYRVVRPPGIAQPIADQPVTIPYDPLEYRLSR